MIIDGKGPICFATQKGLFPGFCEKLRRSSRSPKRKEPRGTTYVSPWDLPDKPAPHPTPSSQVSNGNFSKMRGFGATWDT